MLRYLIIFALLLFIILIYFQIARRFGIIDKPNNRSSHKSDTIRGGGIIFPFAAIFYLVSGNPWYPYFMAGLIIIALVSFWDDIATVSFKIRLLIQLLAVSLLFIEIDLFTLSWLAVIAVYFVVIAWINAFNFMDGINGINAMYSSVTIISFLFINHLTPFTTSDFLLFLLIALGIFSFFNVRKRAKTFSGDVGSVTMAYLLSFFMLKLILFTGHIEYLLLFAVYGIDAAFTIIFRIMRRENIFVAHRSHLYQYLANEIQWSHIQVSVIYSMAQASINFLSIWLIFTEKMNIGLFILILFFLCLIYFLFRYTITKILINK